MNISTRSPISQFPSVEALQYEMQILLRHLSGCRTGGPPRWPPAPGGVPRGRGGVWRQAGFDKINFAGGEPILCPWLPDLIRRARELGLTTSIVTNGSFVTSEWLDRVDGSLDWAAVSIDTVNPAGLKRMGRTTRVGPMSEADYLQVIDLLRQHGIRLKINTVVTRINYNEVLAGFIVKARPERWKLLQVLPVRGQNDGVVDNLVITNEEFAHYVERNRNVESSGIVVVPECNDLMTGSYVMVDPAGRFFDNVAGNSRLQPSHKPGWCRCRAKGGIGRS